MKTKQYFNRISCAVFFCSVLAACHGGNDSDHPPLCGIGDTCQVASIAQSRSNSNWTLNGSAMDETRRKLLASENFGPQGRFGKSINIIDTDETFTLEGLRNFDLLFIGYWSESANNYLTTEEFNALTQWVMEGGRLILTCDGTGHDATCAHFGYPVTYRAFPFAVPANAQSLHPVLNGPFNDRDINNAPVALSQIETSGSQSYFANTDNATVLAYTPLLDGQDHATIIEHRLGSGIVILMGDVDYVSDYRISGSAVIDRSDQNEVFLGNLFSYLLTQ